MIPPRPPIRPPMSRKDSADYILIAFIAIVLVVMGWVFWGLNAPGNGTGLSPEDIAAWRSMDHSEMAQELGKAYDRATRLPISQEAARRNAYSSTDFPQAAVTGLDPSSSSPRTSWLCKGAHGEWGECQLSGDVIVVDLGENTYTWASPPPREIKKWKGIN